MKKIRDFLAAREALQQRLDELKAAMDPANNKRLSGLKEGVFIRADLPRTSESYFCVAADRAMVLAMFQAEVARVEDEIRVADLAINEFEAKIQDLGF